MGDSLYETDIFSRSIQSIWSTIRYSPDWNRKYTEKQKYAGAIIKIYMYNEKGISNCNNVILFIIDWLNELELPPFYNEIAICNRSYCSCMLGSCLHPHKFVDCKKCLVMGYKYDCQRDCYKKGLNLSRQEEKLLALAHISYDCNRIPKKPVLSIKHCINYCRLCYTLQKHVDFKKKVNN